MKKEKKKKKTSANCILKFLERYQESSQKRIDSDSWVQKEKI
jgi:hypothetical protein